MKTNLFIIVFIILIITSLAACGNTQVIEAEPTAAPVITVTMEPTSSTPISPTPTLDSTQEITPTIPVESQKPKYQINVFYDYTQRHLSVDQQTTLVNTDTEPYTTLALQVEANEQDGVFVLKSLTGPDGNAVGNYTLERNHLEFPLSSPLLPGQQASISISYELYLQPIPAPSEDSRPIVFGYTERQTNLVDWFPYLPPYQGGTGWIIHTPWYYGEHQVYPIADFEVTIALVSPPANLQIAAASAAQTDSSVLHYELSNARTFAWSASPEYQILTQDVGNVKIIGYSFPIDEAAAKMALQNTADAVKVYSQLFGPYQHTTLTLVEADFLDGMEYDGLYFLSKGFYNLYDGTPKGYLTAIAVHETAHQWWFAQVANDQALEPWLDEAMATYSERLFYETVYPDLVDWWWAFRVNYYQPTGWINLAVPDYRGFIPYRNAVYLRGAQFLEGIRTQIGDAAFFLFLKDYVSTEKYKIASSSDFFNILGQHTTIDLSTLRSEYFQPQN